MLRRIEEGERVAHPRHGSGDLDIEVMRAQPCRRFDRPRQRGRVANQHLPFPGQSALVHRPRDRRRALDTREIGADAVESCRNDTVECRVEVVPDIEPGDPVQSPDRLQDKEVRRTRPLQNPSSLIVTTRFSRALSSAAAPIATAISPSRAVTSTGPSPRTAAMNFRCS